MKKDLQSFEEHNKEYNELYTLESMKEVLDNFDKEKSFEVLGFKQALDKISGVKTHIDIGCGSGWLLYKTSPLFDRVIGIEPSKAVVEMDEKIAKERNFTNVEFLNMDMIDGIKKLDIKEPVFITTATVLSHIKDFYVKEFLRVLNDLPEGSAIFFDERYDKNIQQNMWHIRSRNWWAKNLPDWQLEFFGLDLSGYKSGIFGRKIKKGQKIENFELNSIQKIKWHVNGLNHRKNRLARFVKNKLSAKKS